MIEFRKISADERETVERYVSSSAERGCDYTFANLFSWGEHELAEENGMLFIRYLTGEQCYLFPIGDGDAALALKAIKKDAEDRGIPLVIKGATAEEAKLMGEVLGKSVETGFCRDCSDYIYPIEDIAGLKGKKYHGKRGHLAKFIKEHPAYKVSTISSHAIPAIKAFLDAWYASRSADEGSFDLERRAIMRMLENRSVLGAQALMISEGNEILAFTVGSKSRPDTFDVHFEKASWQFPAAYTAINVEFSRFILANYPEIVWLNREDDMGIEGLRRAKESWYPCRLIEKYTAKEASQR